MGCAAAFEAVDSEHDAEDLASFIQEVAYLVDEIDPEDVLRDINEDRAVSGFPEVRALDQIEAELAERIRADSFQLDAVATGITDTFGPGSQITVRKSCFA